MKKKIKQKTIILSYLIMSVIGAFLGIIILNLYSNLIHSLDPSKSIVYVIMSIIVSFTMGFFFYVKPLMKRNDVISLS